jgi:hypothetical protein
LRSADPHSLQQPCIIPEDNSFQTKQFLIRFCEEEVQVNDVVLFRAELSVDPDYLESLFALEISLYFSDLANLGGT